jgi:hypothetical protein
MTALAEWAADPLWDRTKGGGGNELQLQLRGSLREAYARITRDKLPSRDQ